MDVALIAGYVTSEIRRLECERVCSGFVRFGPGGWARWGRVRPLGPRLSLSLVEERLGSVGLTD